ncbi:MAG: VPDSG-CTERM sorting domain-containing protein [Opitutaceae bacterium]|nr:VPDSG-CTERM sorting domain-containing protein [Opitutaceae bacterium]
MKSRFLFLACLLGAPAASHAALVTYSDSAAFLAATGATAATTIPTTPAFGPVSSFTSGSLTFSLVAGQSVDLYADSFTTRLTGNTLGISGSESFNVALVAPVFSFGFNFVEPQFDPLVGDTFFESTFTVTLFNGATNVASFVFSRPNDSAQFVGVHTGLGESFNRVEIRETVGGNENDFFGQFFTGTSAYSPNPTAAPDAGSTAALLAAGLAALALLRRRLMQGALA